MRRRLKGEASERGSGAESSIDLKRTFTVGDVEEGALGWGLWVGGSGRSRCEKAL